MLLTNHNMHLVKIESPAVPADSGKSISGSGRTTRWQGDVQAHLRELDRTEVRDGNLITVKGPNAFLPSNLPVYPNEGDILTFTGVPTMGGGDPSPITFYVRGFDRHFDMLGKVQVLLRKAGP